MRTPSRKAQTSIFIVLGVILVLSSIYFISLNSSYIPIFKDQKASSDIQDYVDTCLLQVSTEAQKQLGLSGGNYYRTGGVAYLTDRERPEAYNQKAQGLDFLETVEIPYWYYYDDGAEQFKLNIPPYDTDDSNSIKSQMKRYITENMETCINDFDSFRNVYEFEYDKNDIVTEVEFNDDTIVINLEMPVKITEPTTNTSEYIENYRTEIPNKLVIPYYLARDIVAAEANSSFVEKRILSFMNPYQSSTTRDLLPPFYEFKMTYDFRPWNVKNVENLIKLIINENIGKIQFQGTDVKEFEIPAGLENNEFARNVYANYNKDYFSEYTDTKEKESSIYKKYVDYSITPTFEYFFPTSISIYPSLGDQILLPKPKAVINFLPFFFTEYTAVYEMTIPIVFEIKSNENPYDDFVFNLAIETNIDHNTALRENYAIPDYEPSDSVSASLICDPPQFISAPIRLNITDPIVYGTRNISTLGSGVDGALVTFSCKGLTTCYIRETNITNYSDKNITELNLNLPIDCDPGTLEIYKFGHKKLTINNVNPTLMTEVNLGERGMPSEKNIKVNINILDSLDSRNHQYSEGRDLDDVEKGFIIFEDLEDSNNVKVLEVTGENQYNLSIDIMPGNYSIESFLIYEDEVYIPSMTVKKQELPEMKFESWVSGGINIDKFELDTTDLIRYDTIVINLIDIGVPDSYESLEQISGAMGDLNDRSNNYEPYLTNAEE